jgi:ketosteroid isomerase-like protein
MNAQVLSLSRPQVLPNSKILVLFFLLSLLFFNPLKAQQMNDEAAVKAVVDQFFDAFHAQDSVRLKSFAAPDIVLQSIGKNGKGEVLWRKEKFENFVKSIASIPETTKFEEKLLSYSIQVDGVMANAWTEYEFWINGEFSHCGVNSFHMVKLDGEWKISYLIDTRRRAACEAFKGK